MPVEVRRRYMRSRVTLPFKWNNTLSHHRRYLLTGEKIERWEALVALPTLSNSFNQSYKTDVHNVSLYASTSAEIRFGWKMDWCAFQAKFHHVCTKIHHHQHFSIRRSFLVVKSALNGSLFVALPLLYFVRMLKMTVSVCVHVAQWPLCCHLRMNWVPNYSIHRLQWRENETTGLSKCWCALMRCYLPFSVQQERNYKVIQSIRNLNTIVFRVWKHVFARVCREFSERPGRRCGKITLVYQTDRHTCIYTGYVVVL